MIGLIIGAAVLFFSVHYFTRDQNVDWKQAGIWLILSYIPYIVIMFASFVLVIGGKVEGISWWMMMIAALSQLGVLYYFLQRYYGGTTAYKIVVTYAVAMLIIGWILLDV